MKTYHIKDLLNKEVLVIEMPEGSYPEITSRLLAINHSDGSIKIFKGSYTLLGKPDEIREEDAEKLVRGGSYTTTFWNYKTNDTHKSNQLKTALESFFSALESEIYWENPHGKEEPNKSYFLDDKGSFLRQEKKQWHKAQEKTFDKKRVKIFVKI